MTWPVRKSHSPIRNQRRQYSRACGESRAVSTARSEAGEVKGSKRGATPVASRWGRTLLMPARFAFPHSDACSETSMPVGRRPRKPAITSHDPSGISKRKKFPISASGAGWTM